MPLLDVPRLLRKLPIISLDEASGAGVVSAYREYVKRSAYDSYWETLSIRHSYGRFRMPVLLTGGWYDNYAAENVTNFLGLRQNAPTTKLRDSHRMLIGPWSHGILSTSVLGELDFGPKATGENDASNRWLDTILHGKAPSEFQKAPIRIFVMGLNRWRDEYEWPLGRTRYVNYYLQYGGRLTLDPPSSGKPDRYVYDPANPVPTIGGNHSVGPYNPGLYEHAKPGPYDQRQIEKRRDVLSYTSEALKRDTEVTGPVALKLFASSSARDTDFVAKLTDVHPDGRSINITEGVIRARFRENVWGKPKLLVPHQVYEFTIDMLVTSNVFRKGHRMRVDIMSSNFPLWDRNLNTGNDPGTDATVNTAEQAIHHDREHPSRIVLPVIPAC
jgi:putative CocE/NonD family hydrolase